MALYSYKAIDSDGNTVAGLREAAGPEELASQLRHSGFVLLRCRRRGTYARFMLRRTSRMQLAMFFFSLEQFSRSGVPLLQGLTDLRDGMEDKGLRTVVSAMAGTIRGGEALSRAMAQHPLTFDPILIGLVRAGEESGNLSETFGRIAESLKWQDELASQISSMMLYPAFAGAAVLAVTAFLLVRLVPQLAGFVRQAGQDIPFHTRMLLAVSDWTVHYWPALLAAPLSLYILFRLMLGRSRRMRLRMDAFKLAIRPTGPILRKLILARLVHTIAMMYGSGIGVLDCLSNARNLTRNAAISAGLEQAMREIEAGKTLAQGFGTSAIFPPLVTRMIGVGETTGRLETALYGIGHFYDRDAREAIRRLQILAEPAMTVVLGLLLGWVMLSVLSPIYETVGRMGA